MIYATWFKKFPNWGDSLSPVLIELMSGQEVEWIDAGDDSDTVRYIVIGSILDWAGANTIVWGAGLISAESRLSGPPKAICAVRGPLTREALLQQGISCPAVYGDPALLYPRYYDPPIEKQYELGIIPHYVDKEDPWLHILRDSNDARQIDVFGSVNAVVDQIKSCRAIASSSLHGLIAADAYGIPSTWIKFSDKIHGRGFKFRDYFQSVRRKVEDPLVIGPATALQEIYDRFDSYRLNIDLDALYESCPFRKVC